MEPDTVKPKREIRQLSGPRSHYRPKVGSPHVLRLTAEGTDILRTTARRTGASHPDVVEQLLRRFAHKVRFQDTQVSTPTT